MNEYDLHARTVAPNAVVDAIIGLANSPRPLPSEDVVRIINKEKRYTRAVLHLGDELDLIKEVNSGYVVNSSVEEKARKMAPEQGSTLLNQYILRYTPFMTFVSFLDKGYDETRSAQSIQTLYNIETQADVVKKQFLDLGKYANIITEDNKLEPTVEVETLPTAYVTELKSALESEAKARLFVHEKLGEQVIAYADSESIEKVHDSLFTFRKAPDTAIVEAVVAAENITRELAEENGERDTDYSKANGIGQLAMKMKGDGLILKRHLHGANYLGSMRIPGSHGKQKETLESWEVEEEVALEVILTAMDYVKSLYCFIQEDKQIL